MKRLLLILFTLFATASISMAQIYMEGDLDKNGVVSISDLTVLVDMINGKKTAQTPESLISGTWISKDGDIITLNPDATTNYAGAATFKFIYNDNLVYLYNSSKNIVKLFSIIEFDHIHLKIQMIGEDKSRIYYNSSLFVSSIELSANHIDLFKQETAQISANLYPKHAFNLNYNWVTSDDNIATVDHNGIITAISEGLCTISCIADDGSGVSAKCVVNVEKKKHEYVDLGLSVMWATCNIGTEYPEEPGEYYAWGETTTKEYYDQYTLSPSKVTNYILDPEYDAAHVNWGEEWRMPTSDEFSELEKKCLWTWTDDYNGTGRAGYIIKGKLSGYMDKHIFLPAAGYRFEDRLCNTSAGYYWTKNAISNYPGKSITKYFTSYNISSGVESYGTRSYGQTIRPVCPK